jgi:hypothetical protein
MSDSTARTGEPGWPVASLDPISRAKVLAATIPSAAFHLGVINAPYDEVWSWTTQLDKSVARFDSQVDRVVIQRREELDEAGATLLRMTARTHGLTVPFQVRIEEGFCLMRGWARVYLVIMAAVPEDEGERTRFFHMEAIPLPGAGPMRRIIQREVDADFRHLKRLAEAGFPEEQGRSDNAT